MHTRDASDNAHPKLEGSSCLRLLASKQNPITRSYVYAQWELSLLWTSQAGSHLAFKNIPVRKTLLLVPFTSSHSRIYVYISTGRICRRLLFYKCPWNILWCPCILIRVPHFPFFTPARCRFSPSPPRCASASSTRFVLSARPVQVQSLDQSITCSV